MTADLRHRRGAITQCMSNKMTTTAGLSGLTVFTVVFLIIEADASKELQQLRSSIDRLKALKQLVNVEQVRV